MINDCTVWLGGFNQVTEFIVFTCNFQYIRFKVEGDHWDHPSSSLHFKWEETLTSSVSDRTLVSYIAGSVLHCRWILYWLNHQGSPKILTSVQFSHSVVSDFLRPHELQHARPPCPSPTPRVYSNSCPSSQWCHPAISSSVVPFSSCPQSRPASGSFPMSQLFTWGGQSIGVSASATVLPVNTQDWSPLGWTGWISLQSKGLSRVFSNTTV